MQQQPFTHQTKPTLTVAHALMMALLIMAAVMRLFGLGDMLLSAAEARVALGVPFVASEALLRLLPALLGVATVGLVWLFRPWLGRAGTLTTAALLTFSPFFTLLARTVGWDALALFSGLLLIISLWQWRRTRLEAWLMPAAIALGLGLAAGGAFYSLLISSGLAWIAVWRRAETKLKVIDSRRLALIIGVTFLLIATRALTQLAGIGAAADRFIAWVTAFDAPSLTAFLPLIRFELAAVLIALTAAVPHALSQRRPLARFALIWLGLALVLLLIRPDSRADGAVLLLPVFLLVGEWVGSRLDSVHSGGLFFKLCAAVSVRRVYTRTGTIRLFALATLLTTATITAAFVNLGRFLRRVDIPPLTLGLFFVLLPLIAFGLQFMLAISTRPAAVMRGGVLGILLIALYLGLGNSWWLAHSGAADPRSGWATTTTDPDLRLLIDTLQQVGSDLRNADQDLRLVSAADSPTLRWYLRDFRDVRFAAAPARSDVADAWLVPQTTVWDNTGGLISADFVLSRHAAPPADLTFQQVVLDIFFHQLSGSAEPTYATLYIQP